jgi:hypothetical protein
MQQPNTSYAVDCEDDSNKSTLVCCITRSNDNDGRLQEGNARLHQATTNQIFMLHQGSEQRLQNNKIVDAIIMSYIVSQKATTMATTVNHNKHVRLRKKQTTFFIDVDQPH